MVQPIGAGGHRAKAKPEAERGGALRRGPLPQRHEYCRANDGERPPGKWREGAREQRTGAQCDAKAQKRGSTEAGNVLQERLCRPGILYLRSHLLISPALTPLGGRALNFGVAGTRMRPPGPLRAGPIIMPVGYLADLSR